MPIRLIAFDFDDTLLQDDRSISQENIEAIEYARKRGVKIVPASGRPYSSMLPYTKHFGGFDAMVCTNGSQIYDGSGNRISYTEVSADLTRQVIEFAEGYGCYLQVYDDQIFLYEKACDESRLYERLAGLEGREVGKLSLLPPFSSPKLLFIETDMEKMPKLKEAAQKRFDGLLSIENSKKMYLEVTSPLATKGVALDFLSKHFGIDKSEMMAIGDSGNDLPMIEYAGTGVAVANAKDYVKQKAGFISKRYDESGVAHAIYTFI